ncbi:MAG: hypothetical protein ACRD50_01860 [Candidatus Acidiferrales bacterium]
MTQDRRNFLAALLPTALMIPSALQQKTGSPQPKPWPEDPNHPYAPDPMPPPSPKTRKALLQESQKQMHDDIERLFTLAQDLRQQIEKTDETTVLSLDVVKKAEEIEKLAKKIKDLARG